ncbi:MAG: hypothetical protein JOY54_06560 [Acidobacteriaceae bacterium]|nr:hypothetical protein [Acidobacteriaceae bacterium]
MSDESHLDELFQRYRAACPEVEPSANFMPLLWHKIESRHNFWFVFQGLARAVATASAAVCLLLLILNLAAAPKVQSTGPTYTDALMADHTAERTYYTEALRNTPPSMEGQDATPRH